MYSYRPDGVVEYPIMQMYCSQAMEDNSEDDEVVLDKCSISCICLLQYHLAPAKAADLQLLGNGNFWERIWEFS